LFSPEEKRGFGAGVWKVEILSCSWFTRLSMSLIFDLFQIGEVVISYRLTVFDREGSSSFRFASPISSKFIIKEGAREMI
jgi:hypothetical protein